MERPEAEVERDRLSIDALLGRTVQDNEQMSEVVVEVLAALARRIMDIESVI